MMRLHIFYPHDETWCMIREPFFLSGVCGTSGGVPALSLATALHEKLACGRVGLQVATSNGIGVCFQHKTCLFRIGVQFCGHFRWHWGCEQQQLQQQLTQEQQQQDHMSSATIGTTITVIDAITSANSGLHALGTVHTSKN